MISSTTLAASAAPAMLFSGGARLIPERRLSAPAAPPPFTCGTRCGGAINADTCLVPAGLCAGVADRTIRWRAFGQRRTPHSLPCAYPRNDARLAAWLRKGPRTCSGMGRASGHRHRSGYWHATHHPSELLAYQCISADGISEGLASAREPIRSRYTRSTNTCSAVVRAGGEYCSCYFYAGRMAWYVQRSRCSQDCSRTPITARRRTVRHKNGGTSRMDGRVCTCSRYVEEFRSEARGCHQGTCESEALHDPGSRGRLRGTTSPRASKSASHATLTFSGRPLLLADRPLPACSRTMHCGYKVCPTSAPRAGNQ